LRRDYSITTAAEFDSLAHRHPDELRQALGVPPEELARLAALARAAVPAKEAESLSEIERIDYPFRTGHDSPDGG
jgi:hypothetical protein